MARPRQYARRADVAAGEEADVSLKSPLKRGLARSARTLWQRRTGQRLRYLLLLGHMRSYSSLLGHILGSHPSILGYREHHIPYAAAGALEDLVCATLRDDPQALLEPIGYVLDKVLHDPLMADPGLFPVERTRVIMMYRNPASSLASMVAHLEGWDLHRATRYYETRLATLGRLLQRFTAEGVPVMALRAEDILEQTDLTLRRLEGFLELDESLTPQYRRFVKTGRRGAGDSSQLLGSGAVATASRFSLAAADAPPVPPGAQRAYEAFGRQAAMRPR